MTLHEWLLFFLHLIFFSNKTTKLSSYLPKNIVYLLLKENFSLVNTVRKQLYSTEQDMN